MVRETRLTVAVGLALLASGGLPQIAHADCALPNPPYTPLNDLGSALYQGFSGGLYPGGSNQPPEDHAVAGSEIASNQIQPLDANGNVQTNTGKIVLLSLGMSNTTQEWASGDVVTHDTTRAFKYRADHDPARNPQVIIVDGAIGGEDAIQWTNVNAVDWSRVITQRLVQAGVTTNQVQVMWIKQALASPQNYGAFPHHAQALQDCLARVVRIAKAKYPNLKLAYLTGRTHAWVNGPPGLNPEPFAYETSFASKWLIEDQLNGTGNLNFDSAKGPVTAPWLGWGPYFWAAGTSPRSDGFVWNCEDTREDFTHPSSNGVYKAATHLLAFFKTAPTTTPWFLRKPSQAFQLAISASASQGQAPLIVNFTASPSGATAAVTNFAWTYDDGGFSVEQNPTKVFPVPGAYTVRLTATDTLGNAAIASLVVDVSAPPFSITSYAVNGSDFRLTWSTRGGESYVVQTSSNLVNFADLSPVIPGPSAAVSVTNYTDLGALTNAGPRYYRVRLGP